MFRFNRLLLVLIIRIQIPVRPAVRPFQEAVVIILYTGNAISRIIGKADDFAGQRTVRIIADIFLLKPDSLNVVPLPDFLITQFFV